LNCRDCFSLDTDLVEWDYGRFEGKLTRDIPAAQWLSGYQRRWLKSDIIAGAQARVRDLLRAVGLEDRVGYLGRHISVAQAIAQMQPEDKR
jgi:broad specificity phosphatase PhoE